MSKTTRERIPKDACQLQAGLFELAAPAGDSQQPPNQAVANILARTGDAIPHWYFGSLVHDLAGMSMSKQRLALDYCHDQGDIICYADQWETASGNLTCQGTILVDESPRAAEIKRLADRGVPYEASISFSPTLMERLRPGESSQVNGRLVAGPAVVVRKWALTGLAVCPRGADSNTRTQLAAGLSGELSVDFLEGALQMSDKPTADPGALRQEVQKELTARITDYTARFGAPGQAWALSDRPLVECYQDHVESLTARGATELSAVARQHETRVGELESQLTAEKARADAADERLRSLSLPGEAKPLSSAPDGKGGDNPKLAELKDSLPDGLARFAAGITLPKQASAA